MRKTPATVQARQPFAGSLATREHEADDFFGGDAPLERDALDLVHQQPVDQVLHAGAGLWQRRIGDDELVVDDADGDRRLLLLERLERSEETFDVTAEQRMVGGIELRRACAGREPSQQFVVECQLCASVGAHADAASRVVMAAIPRLRARLWRRLGLPARPLPTRSTQRVHRADRADTSKRVRRRAAELPVGEYGPPVSRVQRRLQRLDRLGPSKCSQCFD